MAYHFCLLGIACMLSAFASPGLLHAQSRSGERVLGSCPDATVAEAQDMGLRQVPVKLPEFVRRGEITAAGVEAVVGAHSTPSFSDMDNAFRTFTEQLPRMQNLVQPKQDRDLLLDYQDDNQPQQPQFPPIMALCYSYEGGWSFTPGAEVDGTTAPFALDNQAVVTIPAQTYAVFEYDGPRADIANFRYSLTSRFWPVSSVRRVESPNFEIYPNGDDGQSENVSLQMWVAVEPAAVPAGSPVADY